MRASVVGDDVIAVERVLLALDWIRVRGSERYEAAYFSGSSTTFNVPTDILLFPLWKGWRITFEQVSS